MVSHRIANFRNPTDFLHFTDERVAQITVSRHAVGGVRFAGTEMMCAIFDAIPAPISRTKRALSYPARMLLSRSIAWTGNKVITCYLKTPLFPISANLAVFFSQRYATKNACGVGWGRFCTQNRIKIASKSHV